VWIAIGKSFIVRAKASSFDGSAASRRPVRPTRYSTPARVTAVITGPKAEPTPNERAKGFRGYPVGAIAFYGPSDTHASKVAVAVVPSDGAEATELKRWHTASGDIRRDPAVGDAIVQFLKRSAVASVVITDGIIGCPHEEGIDYPSGESCPQCPFWANRDRWSGEVIT